MTAKKCDDTRRALSLALKRTTTLTTAVPNQYRPEKPVISRIT